MFSKNPVDPASLVRNEALVGFLFCSAGYAVARMPAGKALETRWAVLLRTDPAPPEKETYQNLFCESCCSRYGDVSLVAKKADTGVC